MQHLTTIMLQTQGAPGSGGMAFIMVGMFIVMYFFMIRPQAKRAKEQKKFADSMNVNEQIVTTAGIHGRIAKANEDGTLRIEISPNTFMTIDRSAISMEMTQAYRKKAEAKTAAPAVAATTK